MKVETIAVNRNERNPEGVSIDVIQPESPTEQNLLCFLLEGFLRRQVEIGKIDLKLPDKVLIDYRGQGAFAVSSPSQASTTYPYYQPPQLLTVVLVRQIGNHFDLIYSRRDQADSAAGASQASGQTSTADVAPVETDESTDHSLDMPAPPPEPVDDVADVDDASVRSPDDPDRQPDGH